MGGSRYFAKVCFGHPSPSKQQNLTRPFMPSAPRPSCVRCVITSSRLYTTPSVTLRRHKAAAASSSSSARALNYEYADGVDYRGLTAFASLSMAVSECSACLANKAASETSFSSPSLSDYLPSPPSPPLPPPG
ncbi:hypothetical protein [Candidatus Reidiella endopervernicosa]|uniref:Uncharacterized protein n=1 Tax=Candidatus Reidiella endopervernicosa TaxID=2738883 RepID=A0A6N0I095_9GAMM|nr:hypothetical protein [Candidatus Reidiella endopervernicosa]QKQ28050.1 hypothetical protein HUE57_18495 [Candidatus Reidiella endopervernicosa]